MQLAKSVMFIWLMEMLRSNILIDYTSVSCYKRCQKKKKKKKKKEAFQCLCKCLLSL